jgi:Adenylosuccinate lyase
MTSAARWWRPAARSPSSYAENKEIAKHMSKAELQKLCDPANYLGQAGEMVDRVLALRGRA